MTGKWGFSFTLYNDRARLNIDQTLLETGPEFSDIVVTLIHNLGFVLLTAASGILMSFPPRLVKENRERGRKGHVSAVVSWTVNGKATG